MNILKIKLLTDTQGTDIIFLYTDLPPSIFPYTENAVLKLELANATGQQYCINNFKDLPIEIIKI
jgi:hypothetical protein